jgi:UDP-N-acetylglucosamine/UDP-N-acetylgalactosamine diphosphorylase
MLADLINTLNDSGQDHIVKHLQSLPESVAIQLASQINSIDFDELKLMQDMLQSKMSEGGEAVDIEPAEVIPCSDVPDAAAVKAGEAALQAGQVAALLVAGGQGSRLGYEGPKGCYPVGPVSNAPLFHFHARKILALEKHYGAPVPFYIMTSQVNHDTTQEFFAENDYFGLNPKNVTFFCQGMNPALTRDGKLILDAPDHIFMNPDGHGGLLKALHVNGVLSDMSNRGITTVYFFQVDNPLVDIADPEFVGHHLLAKADMSVKVCAKESPEEGLGVVVKRGHSLAIVEYSELTDDQKHARQADGELLFKYGSVAIHIFSLSFLTQCAERGLPLHIAHKKVPYLNEQGELVKPDKPNAYKFEKFIFDVLPMADKVLNLEFRREDEFSPLKNAEGNYSPETVKRDISDKAIRWLKACDIVVPEMPDGRVPKIEMDPCFAVNVDVLKSRAGDISIEGDTYLS